MILSPEHPRWEFFCIQMQKLDPDIGCRHSLDFTTECLNLVPGIDIPETIKSLKRSGGHCDCEVIMNVVLPSLGD